MRWGAPIIIAAALLAPLALAGTPDDPDVPGTPDHANEHLDFVGAWFESAPNGVAMNVRVRAAGAPMPDAGVIVSFDHDGARIVVGVIHDADGRAHSYVGPPDFRRNRVGAPSTLGSPLVDEEFIPGRPAVYRALIPWNAIPGLSPGDVLQDPYAGTLSYSRGGWTDEDGRQVETDYVVQRTLVPLAIQRNAIAFLVGTTLLGAALAGGGYYVWRQRSG